MVPQKSPLIGLIMQEFHDSKVGGHGGVIRTQKRISEVFYWKGMMTDIRRYVASCLVCQRQKYSTLAPGGLLQPLPIPNKVWEDISMDFVEGLPRSEGVNAVLVVVDRLTKYGHFISLKHPFSATDVALLFIQEVIKLHGFPRTIVSDRDRVFTSLFWKELFRLSGTRLCLSTAYHPQSDGQTEVTNRGMETYLRCFASEKPRTWAKYLVWAELSYNSSYHSAIKMTPFKAVYGRDPPVLLRYENGSTTNAELEDQLRERDEMLAILRDHLNKAQQIMKSKADEHRREVLFEVGEMVYLKLRPYRQQSLARRPNEKLAARFYGPFEVEAKVGKVAYRLKLPEGTKIHHTFHVSQLKKAIGDTVPATSLPPQLTSDGVLIAEPEAVWNTRTHPRSGQQEVLIKWKNLPSFDCTWETKENMKMLYPELDFEDKVSFVAPSNDTYEAIHPPIVYQYARRNGQSSKGKTYEQ